MADAGVTYSALSDDRNGPARVCEIRQTPGLLGLPRVMCLILEVMLDLRAIHSGKPSAPEPTKGMDNMSLLTMVREMERVNKSLCGSLEEKEAAIRALQETVDSLSRELQSHKSLTEIVHEKLEADHAERPPSIKKLVDGALMAQARDGLNSGHAPVDPEAAYRKTYEAFPTWVPPVPVVATVLQGGAESDHPEPHSAYDLELKGL
jgi:hypothetical protein